MQVNFVGIHLGLPRSVISNITAILLTLTFLGAFSKGFLRWSVFVALKYPVKVEALPLFNGDNFKYCIILNRNYSHKTQGCPCFRSPNWELNQKDLLKYN